MAVDTAPPDRTDPVTLTPVAPGERIVTLDVLRGIALFGVLIANIWVWFSGIMFRFPDYNAEVWSLSPDGLAFLFIAFFISGKAITTFSFLFGLGFAVQMQRAEASGRSIVGHHSRRLAILLLIGALHAVFLWYGDILMAYALLGFGLLLFRNRRERTLLVWAAVLIVLVPLALGSMPVIFSLLSDGAAGPDPAVALGKMTERNAELLALFSSGDPSQIVRGNLQMMQQQWLTPKATFLLVLFGIFLLGLYIGRRRLFEDPMAHRALLRRTVVWGFALGVPATAINLGLRSMPPERIMEMVWLQPVFAVTGAMMVPFAFAYVALATLLMQRAAWRERLSLFAPVGRMALTNYLAQTVICISLYYGAGLVGRAGPLFGLIVALVIFPAQMAFSAWWLARFRYGPMEWVWRSLTYGSAQPMRLPSAPLPAMQPLP